MSHLLKLRGLRDVVLTWALQNGFAPCACDGGMCKHQTLSVTDLSASDNFEAMSRGLHDIYGMAMPSRGLQAYFWVGATTEVPTLELLFSKLAALEYLLIDRGGVVDIRGLGNCGVEFTPTRLPCECAIVRVHVRGAPECSLCDKSWAAHMRAQVQQFAC